MTLLTALPLLATNPGDATAKSYVADCMPRATVVVVVTLK